MAIDTIGANYQCSICRSKLRSDVDTLLVERRRAYEEGLDQGELPFDELAAKIDAIRVLQYPSDEEITGDDLEVHFFEHMLSPAVPPIEIDEEENRITVGVEEAVPYRDLDSVLTAVIGIGLKNLQLDPSLVTPQITLKAIEIKSKREQRARDQDEFEKAIHVLTIEGRFRVSDPYAQPPPTFTPEQLATDEQDTEFEDDLDTEPVSDSYGASE